MVRQNKHPKKTLPKREKVRSAGRPSLSDRTGPGERSPLVCIRLPPPEVAAVDSLAKRHGVKRSEMIRQLIDAGRKAFE
jgi:hypothetical protein